MVDKQLLLSINASGESRGNIGNTILAGSGLGHNIGGNQLQFDDGVGTHSGMFPSSGSIGDPIIKPFTISTPNLQNVLPSSNNMMLQ